MGIGSVSNASVNPAVVDGVSTLGQLSNGSNRLAETKETHQVTKKDSLASRFKCVAWKSWVVSKLGTTLGYLAMLPSLPILLGLAAYDGLVGIANGVSLLFRKITEIKEPVQKFLPVAESQEPDSSKELANLYIEKGRAAQEHKAEKEKLEDQIRYQADQAQRLRDNLQQSDINNDRMVRQYQDEKVKQEAELRDQASQIQQLTADLEDSKNDLYQAQADFRLKTREFEELLQKKKQEHHNRVVDLRSHISEKEKEAKKHQLTVSEYEKQLQKATMNSATQEGERREFVDNHKFLLQQQADTNANLGLLTQQIETERLNFINEKTQLEFRINQLNSQCHELEIKARGTIDPQQEQELKANTEELAMIRTDYQNLQEKNLQLLFEKKRLKKSFIDAVSKIKDYQKMHAGAKRCHLAQVKEIQSNRANLSRLSGMIEALEEESQQLREKVKKQDHDKCMELERSKQKMMAMAKKMEEFQLMFNKYVAQQEALQKSCSKQLEDNFGFELDEALCEAEALDELISECCDYLDSLTSESELLKEELTQQKNPK